MSQFVMPSSRLREFSIDEVDGLIASKEVIGEGGFGVVYKARLDDGTDVAVKCLKETKRREALRDEEALRLCNVAINREIDILSKFDHPNIVKLIGLAKGPECRQALVFELCDNGTLHQALSIANTGDLSASWLLSVAIGVARGLVHMHGIKDDQQGKSSSTSSGVVLHRDVKSLNIGLCGSQAKLIDCGSSRRYDQDPNITFSLSSFTGNVLGTPGYIADEVANGDGYGVCSEVFSFGVVLLEMLTGKPAKGLVKTVKRALLQNKGRGELSSDFLATFQATMLGKRVPWPAPVLEQVLLLALICTEADAEDRPCTMRVVLTKLCKALELQCKLDPPTHSSSAPQKSSGQSAAATGASDHTLSLREMQRQIAELQEQMRGLFDVCITCANKFTKGQGLKCAEDHAMCPPCADAYLEEFLKSLSGNKLAFGCEYQHYGLCSAPAFTDAQVCHGCPNQATEYMRAVLGAREKAGAAQREADERKRTTAKKQAEEELRRTAAAKKREEEERRRAAARRREEEEKQQEAARREAARQEAARREAARPREYYHPGEFRREFDDYQRRYLHGNHQVWTCCKKYYREAKGCTERGGKTPIPIKPPWGW